MNKNINKTNILNKKTDNTKSILNDTIGGHTMNNFETLQSTRHQNIYYTKLFLEKYREIVWTMKFYANHNEPIFQDKSLYTIIQSYPEIKSLISIFNLTMKQIKRKPKDGWLMYDILYFSYMDDKELCVSEIIYDEIGISESTYFRKKKLAIELISERLWNTSHQDVAAWQKFVKALDDKQHREEAS